MTIRRPAAVPNQPHLPFTGGAAGESLNETRSLRRPLPSRGVNEASRTRPPATVTALRRSVPCASGWALGIPVEIHFEGGVGRAAVALHELHQLAEDGLDTAGGDALLAVATAADLLAERLHGEPGNSDVAIAVGTALSQVGCAALSISGSADSAVVIRRGDSHVAVGTACERVDGGGDVATASSSTAAASVRVARSVLRQPSGRIASLRPRGSVLLIRSDGTVESGSVGRGLKSVVAPNQSPWPQIGPI